MVILNRRVPVIAVIGAHSADAEVLEIAKSVGEAIADHQCHLVCGGKQGVMEAACKGFRFARNELSTTRVLAIGVLPEDSSDYANDYLDLFIPTGMGLARNAIITRMADGVIAIGGESGTLSEIAYAWQMKKPIVAMKNSGGWSEELAGQSLDATRNDVVVDLHTGHEAMRHLLEIIDTES